MDYQANAQGILFDICPSDNAFVAGGEHGPGEFTIALVLLQENSMAEGGTIGLV